MFDKLKAIFCSKKEVKHVTTVNPESMATFGLDIGKHFEIDNIAITHNDDFKIVLGNLLKTITAKSKEEGSENTTHRFYTLDDGFLQISHFGEDKPQNINDIFFFKYLLDEGFEVGNDTENEDLVSWKQKLDSGEVIEFLGSEYSPVTETPLSGVEVVELEGGKVNKINNYSMVYYREINDKLSELLMINIEQQVELNDDLEITEYGDILVSFAVGSPLNKVDIKI